MSCVPSVEVVDKATCPRMGTVYTVSPTEGISAGDTITLLGCDLDPVALKVQLYGADGDTAVGTPIDLTSVSGATEVSFTAPAVTTDGIYYLVLLEGWRVIAGVPCPPLDSADTGTLCVDFTITYGVQ